MKNLHFRKKKNNKVVNDELRWDTVAPVYDEEVFDVYKSDKKGVLKKKVLSHRNLSHRALDFGCGMGKALPMLTPLFKEVVAIDVSKNLLEIAKKKNYKNVIFKQADLAEKNIRLPKVDFVLSCNVSISGDNERNFQLIRNALNALVVGGTAVFVLPSMESMSFATWMLIKMYQKEGVNYSKIPQKEIYHLAKEHHHYFKDGIIHIEDTPTKHYLLTEIVELFQSKKYSIETIDRIEYDWETELLQMPKGINAPDPWDWLVEVKRIA